MTDTNTTDTDIINDIREGLEIDDIDELLFLDFFDVVASAIDKNGMSNDLYNLLQDLDALYAFGDADSLPGFALGTCWGALKTLFVYQARQAEKPK